MILAVAGNPIAHSKSPFIFNSHFLSSDIDGTYTRFAAESGKEIADTIRELSLGGMNVTAPFKDKVIPWCDEISDTARDLQSVNTLVYADGRLSGYSTDGYGVEQSLKSAIDAIHTKNALLIGAGGAGRMAALALDACGVSFGVVNRTFSKSETLAAEFGADALTVEEAQARCDSFDIVVNTLPAGAQLFSGNLIREGAWLLDAVYTPNQFRDEALTRGARVISGESWLLHQADGACRHFSGSPLHRSLTPQRVSAFAQEMPPVIAVTGFMGSGKSTLAEELAAVSSIPLVDMDIEIEKNAGESIENIFKERGEPHFRKLESDLLQKVIASGERVILSCGGGIISNEENNALLRDKTYTVWVHAPVKASFDRIHDTGRPLAKNGFTRFQELFEERKFKYASSSDILIRNFNKSSRICARRIYEEISLLSSH